MTEVDKQTETQDEPFVSKTQLLKEKADLMGIQYPKNATAAKMEELIEEHEKLLKEQNSDDDETRPAVPSYDKNKVGKVRDEAMKLIRVRIIVNDPTRQTWTGIPITAGNDMIGHVTRVIPLNASEWHVEAIILEHMKSMKYQHFPQKKGLNNTYHSDTQNAKLLPVFTIIELPPLSQQELKDLAKRQAEQNTGQTEDK